MLGILKRMNWGERFVWLLNLLAVCLTVGGVYLAGGAVYYHNMYYLAGFILALAAVTASVWTQLLLTRMWNEKMFEKYEDDS